MFFIAPSGCHEVQIALAGFFQSLDKSSIWCYNIIGDNSGIISHILQLDHITPGYVLLTANLVALKRGKFRKFTLKFVAPRGYDENNHVWTSFNLALIRCLISSMSEGCRKWTQNFPLFSATRLAVSKTYPGLI